MTSSLTIGHKEITKKLLTQTSLVEVSEKVFFKTVIPVKLVPEGLDRGTGIQSFLKQFESLDSCFRRNDTLKP